MQKPPFTEAWDRIKQFQGETFTLNQGKHFKYLVIFDKNNDQEFVIHNSFYSAASDWPISREEMETAYAQVPIDRVSDMGMKPAYKWAILHDPRIVGWLFV